jgi:ribonuclease VapC
VAEALIVAARRNVGEEVARLINGLDFEIVSVTPAWARRIESALRGGFAIKGEADRSQ